MWEILEEEEHNLRLIGLGARDTLRTEMGFCLYGQDIDENKSPKEAGLMWAVHAQGEFPGVVFDQHIQSRQSGLTILDSNRIARPGQAILNPETLEIIGEITSRCPFTNSPLRLAM